MAEKGVQEAPGSHQGDEEVPTRLRALAGLWRPAGGLAGLAGEGVGRTRPEAGCEPPSDCQNGSRQRGVRSPRRCRTPCPRPQPPRSSFSVLVTPVAGGMALESLIQKT